MKLFKTLAHLYHPRRSNNHRARILHPEVIGIFSLLIFGFFTSIYASTRLPGRLGNVLGYASNISPGDVIAQTNQQRTANGLSELRHNDRLSAAAAGKAQDMFSKQYWAHTSPDGTQPWAFIKNAGYSYQVAGENLARDFSETGEMMGAWMGSPTHRANILNTKYSEIGVAVVNGTLEGVETTLVVQMFGAPRTAVAQVAPAKTTTTTQTSPKPAASPRPAVTPRPQVTPTPVVTPSPEPTPEVVAVEQTTAVPQDASNAGQRNEGQVLASLLLPSGSITVPPLFTPLQLVKGFFLAMIMMLIFTLVYDAVVIGNRQALRLVGHNLSHVLLLAIVAYLIISFKAGVLG
jgi:uncharacterized protein YkwD